MKKVLLFITSTILAVNLYAQEGTKQFMPNNDVTERLWLEFELNGQTNGTEGCPENERINIYLRAGEKLRFGMKMADFAWGDYDGTAYSIYIDDFSFRLRKPNNTQAIARTQICEPGDAGFIENYDQAVAGPNGAKLNGQTITNGYTPIVYTATETGNYFIEFESWDNYIGGSRNTNWRFALELFDVTVTDADDNIITNPGDPNRSAGRLWSKSWALTTASFTKYPINAHFFVVTSDEFINKVNFKQYPYSFKFVANHYGIKTESEDDHYVRRTQSQVNDQISGSIGEYPIFLNDPDRSVWPNTMLPPPTVEVWTEEGKFFDYQYNRNPMYVDTDFSNVVLTKNHPDCPHQDITFFKIDANIDGFTAILIDANNDGTFTTDGSDRVIYRELRKGLNYILWDFKTDNDADVPNGTYSASATFYGRGPSHFPMHDVEQLDGIVTSAIRPFNKLVNTIYWDDRNIQDPTG
ncbi:MAG TPA: hypothetical protein PL017_07585, partial [Tenuifilaceae bacterium]|nr:hypothetical protein [Tenuifilaceae bacterium]